MQGWVILEHPVLMLVYGAALLLCLLEKKWRATHGVFFYLSGALVITATTFLFLNGAGLWEAAAWLTVFLLLIMGVKE